jgi:hypothetical protein
MRILDRKFCWSYSLRACQRTNSIEGSGVQCRFVTLIAIFASCLFGHNALYPICNFRVSIGRSAEVYSIGSFSDSLFAGLILCSFFVLFCNRLRLG